jgi:hypothetical protein
MLGAVLLVALLVARTCGSSEPEIEKEQAIAVARERIPFEPEQTRIRYVKQGFKGQAIWAVSLARCAADGSIEKFALVRVDVDTGEVVETKLSEGRYPGSCVPDTGM